MKMLTLKTVVASTLLALLVASYAVEALETESFRNLLQKKKSTSGKNKKDKEAEAEKKREEEALKAYEKQQAAREKEKDKLVKQAAKESEETVADFNKAESEKDQIAVFVDLWKNAKGPTILKALTTLMSAANIDSIKEYYVELVAESIQEAIRKGYSGLVAEGVASGLTIVEREEDGKPLLDAILHILRIRNKAKKGTGCTYVKNLMTDAEFSAIESGYENEFTQSFDAPRYLDIMECFLGECEGVALACCKDDDASEAGSCDCDDKEQRTCAYNVFWRQPRTIWRCNGESCVTSKCLCPVIKTKASSKASKKTSSKAKTSGKSKTSKKNKTSTKTKTSSKTSTKTSKSKSKGSNKSKSSSKSKSNSRSQ